MKYPLKRVENPDWPLLIERLRGALVDLGLRPADDQIEALAVGIRVAMDNDRRRFHTTKHLFQFEIVDAVEQLAVLYHDVVYWNVDAAWPAGFEPLLTPIAPHGNPGAPLAEYSSLPFYSDILAIFGLAPGGVTGPVGGNELFSAFVFAGVLGKTVGRETTLAVAACIEATIPFRSGSPRETLYQRITALGITDSRAETWVRRAVRVANEDVENFRCKDAGEFLSGTWALMPELNASLRVTGIYSIQSYREALEGMEKFLLFLQPDFLYTSWRGEPSDKVLQGWKDKAAENLAVARSYLGVKVLTTAILEAFARATGGNVPFSLFMGSVTAPPEARLESLLPPLEPQAPSDKVASLLETGRSARSSFDLTNSPVSAWLYRETTAQERQDQLVRAKALFSGSLSPEEFLNGWPGGTVTAIARALSKFVPTRGQKFLHWV